MEETLQKMIDDIIESDKEIYPGNTSLILSNCNDLSHVNRLELRDDILSIIIYNDDDGFSAHITFNFGLEMDIDISLENITKIINNFELVNVGFDKKTYTKEQLMGG